MKNLIASLLAISFLVFSCGDKGKIERLARQNADLSRQVEEIKQENTQLKDDFQKLQDSFSHMQFLAAQMQNLRARIVTNYGDIEVKFYPDKAPLTCFNFITRAECGFYDNTQFHRVIPGFMIQGGDPNSKDGDPYNDGQGGPLVNIPNEFNDTDHRPGVLSMARVSDPRAGAGCQFFIMHGSAAHLNNQYSAFGEVTGGMDVVNEIANARTYGNSDQRLQTHPVQPVVIKTIAVYRAQN
ncbi:MAG: peptidylprolyl isomerase [Calditrichaceae bacterium]|nr:peptidylprolyl isomerase [Calditrichia bacterium]NUQ40849.1 peptidylprolyl isomerase [Calditrichaceae bacterium]